MKLELKPVHLKKEQELNQCVYIADEAYSGHQKRLIEFSEAELANMRDGEIRQKLIDSDLQSYDDLLKAHHQVIVML